MGILSIVAQNVRRGSRTRRPDDEVPCPPGFRGEIRHDASKCVGCTTCVYVCAPGGIVVEETGGGQAEWRYWAGQCTFCGRCVEFCPTQAVTIEEEPVAIASEPAENRVAHAVPRQQCARCGQPIKPIPEPLLERLYGKPLPNGIADLRRFCERCRGRLWSERIKGTLDPNESGGG